MADQQNNEQKIETETILDWAGNHSMKLVIQLRAVQNQLAQSQEQNAKLVKLLDETKQQLDAATADVKEDGKNA